MSRFLALDNPIFFTPPSGKESGPRRLFKGGGGGSSGTPYYAQQDRLFGTQADISQQLYNQYAEMAPTYLANTQGMVDDAMDGTLAKQMRDQAGNESTATMGAALDANNRNMQRYGMQFNSNRLLSESNRNAVMGAAQKAGAMSQANATAEEQKWNRNAGAYGQISGMGTGAMSGMGSAGAGYGQMGAASQSASMANAQGFGKFGSAIAGIGMGYAKGGEVKRNKFASGAYVRKPFVNHLSPIDWRSMPATQQNSGGVGSTIGSMAMGAVPVMAVLAAKDLAGKDSRIIDLGKSAAQGIKNFVSSGANPTESAPVPDVDTEDLQASSPTFEQQLSDSTGDGKAMGFGSDPTKDSLSSMTKAAASKNLMPQSYSAHQESQQFIDQGDAAAKEIARQQAEEEARRIAAEQAQQATQTATSSMDGAYARGGFVKRGVKMATGGFAQKIGGESYDADPDKFKAKPLTAAEQMAQRAETGIMGAALNPRTYTKGYDRYQKEVAKIEGKKSLVDSNPETPGVAETSPVDAPAVVEDVPLQEAPAATDQQQFSQAFNEATAPEHAAPADAAPIESGPATVDSGTATAATDGAAPAVDTGTAVTSASADGASAAADGAAGTAGAATDATSGVADAASATGDATAAATGAADGAAAGADAAASGIDAGGVMAVGKGVADIAAGRDAGEAVADAAAGYAGAEAGATIGSMAGPVGTVVGGVLGGVLGGAIFADGGEVETGAMAVESSGSTQDPYAHTKGEDELDMWERVQRNAKRGPGDDILHMTGQHQDGELNSMQKVASAAGDPGGVMLFKQDGGDIERADFTPGGDVSGPGTETSDDIPAWLSDGEIVHNADAVKLVGKDALLAINDAGLAVREGKESPEEAQAKVGQVMIARGKQLAGGSSFVKRGVKLAGGGFLGGNLGVALGAGVDQYNIQSARADQKERFDKAYELQKENNDRLNKQAEQQAVEFENKQKDRKDADSLKANIIGINNKYQTIGKDADQYIAKEEASNRATAEANGQAYEPFTPEQKDVLRQSVSKTPEQEYIDAFRGAGQLDAATAQENKRDLKDVGEKVSVAAKDPVLKAIAKTNPIEAAKLHIGEVNLKERLEASERNQALRTQAMLDAVNRKIDAKNASGNGTKKDGTPANYYDRQTWTDKIYKDQPAEVADVAHSFYVQMYDEALRKNGGVSDKDNAEMVRIANEAATAKTFPTLNYDKEGMGYSYAFKDKGGNIRYLRSDAAGSTLNTQTGKPFFDEKQRNINEMDSLKHWAAKDPELYRQAFSAAGNTAELSKMIKGRDVLADALRSGSVAPEQVKQAASQYDALDKAVKLADILRNHPDWMKNATNTPKANTSTDSPWYSGDYPTNLSNSEGTPNVIANGINSTRNWFAEQARKAQGNGDWGTQRKW